MRINTVLLLIIHGFLKEWLLVYKARKAQRWFERNYDNQTKKNMNGYFGPHLDEVKSIIYGRNLPELMLYFYQQPFNLNSEQLRPIYHWFYTKLLINMHGILISQDLISIF